MRRLILFVAVFCLATASFGGFRAKSIKRKRPEKFQASLVISGVTLASDLLLTDKEQTEFFYKALNPSNVIALRLAIFNDSKNEVLIPLEGIQLIGPDGKALEKVDPEAVAQAVLEGLALPSKDGQPPVKVAAGPRLGNDPQYDPSDPRYDPRYDPRNDPTYDPSDPRYTGQNRRYRTIGPGVDVVLNPSGGSSGSDPEVTRRFIQKDFVDKAYLPDPVLPSMTRDRFLYFSITEHPAGIKGFELRILGFKGVSQAIGLKF